MSERSGARPSFGRTIVASAPDRKRVNPAPSGRGGGAKSMPSRHGAHAADPVAGEGGGAPPGSGGSGRLATPEPILSLFRRLGETFPGDGHCQGGGPETYDAPSCHPRAIPGASPGSSPGVLAMTVAGCLNGFRRALAGDHAVRRPPGVDELQAGRRQNRHANDREFGRRRGRRVGALAVSGRGINLFRGLERELRASRRAPGSVPSPRVRGEG